MKSRENKFSGQFFSWPKQELRQIFIQPVIKKDKNFTVLEFIERHNGYHVLLPLQADGLM